LPNRPQFSNLSQSLLFSKKKVGDLGTLLGGKFKSEHNIEPGPRGTTRERPKSRKNSEKKLLKSFGTQFLTKHK
jgi:hypothetical protein